MTNHEAIVKLVQAGMIKFPEPETRSVQAIKHSNKRRVPGASRFYIPPVKHKYVPTPTKIHSPA